MPAPDGPETELLLARAANGDAGAREELLNRYRAPLRRMVSIRMDRRALPPEWTPPTWFKKP